MRSHFIVMDDWRTRYRADQLQGRLGVNSWRGGLRWRHRKQQSEPIRVHGDGPTKLYGADPQP